MKRKLIFAAIIFVSALGGKLFAQAQWMAGLNDNIHISQLSLPGAHDAATESLTIGKCQDKDIAELWDAGVRVFDLRPSDSGDECMIYHGNAITGNTGVTLKAALTTINNRLTSNGSEFAIVLMRKEDGGDSWASKVKAIMDQFSNVMPFRSNLRLGDVRGRILVLSRDYFADGYTINYWNDNATRDVKSANGVDFVVQDYYNVSNASDKSTAIANILSEARTNTCANRLFINHTSGYYPGAIAGLSDDITGNANSSNTHALNTINANPGPTGIIMMDYAGSSNYNGASLVSKIIAQNSNIPTQTLSSPYTGVALADIVSGNDYYLYNVESGLWLQNNDRKANDWSTRGQLGIRGLDFQLNAVDGGYKINAKFGRASMSRDNYYLDNNDDHVWVFGEAVSGSVSNAVTIKSLTKYLTADNYTAGNGYDNMYKVGEKGTAQWYLNNPENSTNGTWQIVTKEERLAKMLADGQAQPADATWLIQSPDFANNDRRYDHWNKKGGWARGGDADGDWGRGSMIVESWNSGDNVEISQEVSVPNGRYSLTFQGFYRDGSVEDVGTRYANGNEKIRAMFYANGSEAPLRSIIYPDHTSALTDPARWPKQTGDTWYVPNSMQDCSRAMNIENVYHNDPIEATVTDGILRIGVKKTGSSGNDWVIMDNFKLTYLGPVVDLGPYVEGLNNAIAEAEAYQGMTTDVLQAALDVALEEARNVRTSQDIDILAAAAGKLSNALTAAKSVNVSALRPTVVLAKAEGIDVAAQEEYLANGTVNEVDSRLRFVRNLRKLNAIEKVDITRIECSEPAEGEFYLYNVGAGIFFSTTADWGTHIAIDNPGMLIKFVQDGENLGLPCFRLSGNGWNGLNWQEEYWDKNGEHKFHFSPVEGKERTYYLNVYDNHNWHFVYDPADDVCDGGRRYWNSVQKRNWNVDDYKNNPYAQWKLVSPEAYKAAMYKATEASPLDVTFLIENPNFTKARVDNADNWIRGWEGVGGQMRGNNEEPWMVIEWYESSANMTQTITGLTPGLYQVSCYGFYRDGSSDNEAAKVKNGETLIQNAFLTASALTDVQVALPNVTSEAGKMPGVGETRDGVNGEFACWPWQANQYFQTGLYKVTTPAVEVGEDGTLTIGISSEYNGVPASWVVVGNFRLTSLGVFEYATVGASNYTTFVAPYDIDEMPEGVEAYACQMQADYVHLEPVNAIPAGEAVVLKNTGTYRFCPAESAVSMEAENDLLPSDGSVVGGDNIYVLAKPESAEVGFYRTNSSLNIPSGKGYLQVSNAVKAFYGFESNDATGLTELNATLNSDEVIYNLAGQRLSKQQKGINIVNGKKVLK